MPRRTDVCLKVDRLYYSESRWHVKHTVKQSPKVRLCMGWASSAVSPIHSFRPCSQNELSQRNRKSNTQSLNTISSQHNYCSPVWIRLLFSTISIPSRIHWLHPGIAPAYPLPRCWRQVQDARPAEDDTGGNPTIRWNLLQTYPFPDLIGGKTVEKPQEKCERSTNEPTGSRICI